MNTDELNEMMEWFAKECNNLPITEQLVIAMAFTKFAEVVKPIYMKHKMKESGGSSFLFKL